MITENYVSFEVAKLLKEKGFNEKVSRWYVANSPQEGVVTIGFGDKQLYINAPTQQMAMKWLREVHSLYIWIGHSAGKSLSWYYEIHGISDGKVKHIGGIQYGSYELACGEAIKYCLENFIEL